MANVEGVGPDAPTITLDGGGQRSATPFAFDQLPPRAMFAIARRFQYGMDRGYAPGNWKKLPVANFIGHGLQHVFAFLMGDTQEGDPGTHLEAAAWNFLAAVEVYLIGKENTPPIVMAPTTHIRHVFRLVNENGFLISRCMLCNQKEEDNPQECWRQGVVIPRTADERKRYDTILDLRNLINTNKTKGLKNLNPSLEYALEVLEEIERNAHKEE